VSLADPLFWILGLDLAMLSECKKQVIHADMSVAIEISSMPKWSVLMIRNPRQAESFARIHSSP
jgi:hypothetical protein